MPAITSTYNQFRVVDVSGGVTANPGTITLGPLIAGADNEPERATFGAFLYGLAPASGTMTDLFLMQGAAGKVIRVKSIILSGTATSATNVPVILYKRTTNQTGGTTTAVTRTAKDSADGTANMVLNHFGTGAAPTPGTGAMVDGGRLNLAPSANGSIDRLMFQYSWQNEKAIVLRGASEWLAVNFNGVSTPAGVGIDFACTWTEE